MEVYLEHPHFLWILVAALPLLVFAALESYAIAPSWKRASSFAVRFVALACVVLALCRPVLRMDRPDEAVVFALDISDSLDKDALQECIDYVVTATEELGDDQRAALLVYGGRPKVLVNLRNEPITLTDAIRDVVFHRDRKKEQKNEILSIEANLSGDGAQQRLDEARAKLAEIDALEEELRTKETDIREALRLARSVLPDDARRRIVLFGDGNWTRSDPDSELAFLARAGITVDTKVVASERPAEVIAERLVAPGQVRINEPVELEVHISSADEREAELTLLRDQFVIKTDTVKLQKGKNRIRIPKQELDEGFHEFQVVVKSENDPRPENNIARAVVVVAGRPKVLLVEADERDARYLEQALRDEDIHVEVRPPIGFPEDLNDLLDYDVLVMSDLPATDLHSSQLGMVKRYVREFGGGLIMLGGEKSFGLGGYYRTPVEDALPVRMPIKKTIEKPSLALCLVLDRSGSMTGEKLSLAKEAAIAAVEVLKRKDQIGVVVFDDAADWVVELQPAGHREEIVTQVSRIVAGGGTHIYRGLYRAYEALADSNAKLKHVILLSDGHTTGSREDHLDLATRMSAEQITISTVGIGDADQALLQGIAELGGGEAYFTNDFGNIPQIFTKETLRASKSMLVEEPFVPTPTGQKDQMLKGVELADAPILMGYISTTPKERATLLLVSDYNDPILAHWNYGLGRSVAFTSDAKNRWATDWISWPQFGKFWAQVVRSVMSTGTTSALQQTADIRVERGEVKVAIDTRSREGVFLDEVQPNVAIVEASGAIRAVPAAHTAPGMYEAAFDIDTYGDFLRLRVESRLGDKTVSLRNYAVVESYPPEYRSAVADQAFMEHASKTTNGRHEPEVATAFEFEGAPARGLKDLWRICILLAGLLLPLDIALRRIG